MRKLLSLVLFSCLLFLPNFSNASTQFTVSANMPLGTGIGFTVNSINAATNVWTLQPAGTTTINFGTLLPNSSGTFLPTSYFAIDISVIGGAGSPDTTVTYADLSMPTGQVNGLGTKAVATFAKEVYNGSNPPLETKLAQKRLLDLTNYNQAYTTVTGGWLRVYLGVSDGSTNYPSNSEPFTSGDQAGAYSGTLTFTEVVN